jgi:hypothetical protein
LATFDSVCIGFGWTRVAFCRLTRSTLHRSMNLLVASRFDDRHLRFDVEGRWRSGDALKLAYLVKAAAARARQDHVLIDLRRVATPPGAQGKFLICDRLSTKVGLLATPGLVDTDGAPAGQGYCPDVALFDAECDALDWLRSNSCERAGSLARARKNPPAGETEGLKGREKKLEETRPDGWSPPRIARFLATTK